MKPNLTKEHQPQARLTGTQAAARPCKLSHDAARALSGEIRTSPNQELTQCFGKEQVKDCESEHGVVV